LTYPDARHASERARCQSRAGPIFSGMPVPGRIPRAVLEPSLTRAVRPPIGRGPPAELELESRATRPPLPELELARGPPGPWPRSAASMPGSSLRGVCCHTRVITRKRMCQRVVNARISHACSNTDLESGVGGLARGWDPKAARTFHEHLGTLGFTSIYGHLKARASRNT
jgi:hypothetical protein